MKKPLSDEIHVIFRKRAVYRPHKNRAEEMGFETGDERTSKQRNQIDEWQKQYEQVPFMMRAILWTGGAVLFAVKIFIGVIVLWLWYKGIASAIAGDGWVATSYIFGGVVVSFVARLLFPTR